MIGSFAGHDHAVTRIGLRDVDALLEYLHAHHREAIFLLHDLLHRSEAGGEASRVLGYRTADGVVGVQCLFPSGRWLPHVADAAALRPLLEDAAAHPLHWAVGARRVLDPLIDALGAEGLMPVYDQVETLAALDPATFRPHDAPAPGRRAARSDVMAIAELRKRFEAEYFPGGGQGPVSWYRGVAEEAIRDGAYVAEVDGVPVAMVSVEADIPELVHIGAVYTRPAYRGRGLAKAVVTAICREALRRRPRVTLTVSPANAPAWRAYEALGFYPWDEYRLCRLARREAGR